MGVKAVAERRAGSGTRPDTQPGFCLKFSPGSDLRSGPQPRSFHPFPRPPCQCSDPAEVGPVSSTGCVLESWTYRPRKSRSWPGVHWPGFPSWSSILMSPQIALWDFSLDSSLPRTFWGSCLPKTCFSTHPYSGHPDVSVITPCQPNPILIAGDLASGDRRMLEAASESPPCPGVSAQKQMRTAPHPTPSSSSNTTSPRPADSLPNRQKRLGGAGSWCFRGDGGEG